MKQVEVNQGNSSPVPANLLRPFSRRQQLMQLLASWLKRPQYA